MRIPVVIVIGVLMIGQVCFAAGSRTVEHDFGAIAASAVVSHTFMFDEDIKSVIALCDCVTASVVKSVHAGKKQTQVLVKFDPASYQGPVSQEIFLLDKDSNRITLRLKAFVR